MRAAGLVVSGVPENLRLLNPFGVLVEHDMYDICHRIKEVDPSLLIYEMPERSRNRYSIVELCRDGVERFVLNADALDARVITSCERMLRIPFEHRFAEFEKLEAKWQEEERQRALDEMYESMGGQMWIDLERCGFIQRPKSYAKRGVTHAAK